MGLDAFKKLEELNKVYKDIRFITYGSLNDADYLKKSLEFGAITYTLRPVRPSELKKCLEELQGAFVKIQEEKIENKMQKYLKLDSRKSRY